MEATALQDEAMQQKPFRNLRAESCPACEADNALRPQYVHQAPFPAWLNWQCTDCGYHYGATGTARQ